MTRPHSLSRSCARQSGRKAIKTRKVTSARKAVVEQLEARHLLASDYLLVIDGVKGESRDSSHPGAIEVQSFSWGASNPGLVASPLTTEAFRFVTNTSSASPQLLQAAAEGKHLTKAVLYARKSGEAQKDFLKVEMKEVFVTSFQSRSLNEELPKDEIAIKFSSITQQVTSPAADGTAGEIETTTWTIPQHVKTVPSDSLLSQQPSSNLDQTDTFLLLDGIKGDSQDKLYRDAIPVESFSWGASQSSSSGGSGRASFQDLHLVSHISKASPLLASSVASGKHFPDAVLVVRRPAGDTFLKIKLTDVLISSYSAAASSGTSPMDEIHIKFGTMEQFVSPDGADGRTVSYKMTSSAARSSVADNLLDNTVPSAAASDFLLEIDGIKGESAITNHKGAIELDSFSWGVSFPSSISSSNGGGSGKVNVQDFSFTSVMSSASPLLMSKLATGTHIADASLIVRRSGERPADYIKIKLADLLVSSYKAEGVNNQLPTEQFSLNFAKVTYDYQSPPTADGQIGSSIKFDWAVPASADRVPNTTEPYAITQRATQPAAGYFMKFDGVDGESTDKDHKGEIEILSWSFGASQPSTASTGGGMGAGKAVFQDFHFVLSSGKSSPKLYQKIFETSPASEVASLSVRRTGASSDYFKLKLGLPDLRSVQLQSIDHAQPIEEFTASYIKIDMRYDSVIEAKQKPTLGSVVVRPRDGREVGDALISRTSPVSKGADYFLKIDGIKGESSDATSSGAIDIQSFSWGVSQSSHAGSGAGSGKVSLQDFHFVMDSSSTTPQVLQAFASGKHFAKVELSARTSGNPLNHLKVELEESMVSSFQTQGSSGAASQDEVSLNFLKIGTQVVNGDGRAPVSSSLDFSKLGDQLDFVPGESILSLSAPSQRSADYYLKFDGIDGESKSTKHKDWIEILSFSWRASRDISSDRRLGHIKWENMRFSANTDTTSPQLLSAIASGTHIPRAQLDITGAGDRPYLKYELQDLLISSFDLDGSSSSTDTDFAVLLGQLSATASPPSSDGRVSTSNTVDIFFTDQDEFIGAKKRR